jgi:hypothetical protein
MTSLSKLRVLRIVPDRIGIEAELIGDAQQVVSLTNDVRLQFNLRVQEVRRGCLSRRGRPLDGFSA